MAKLLHLHVRKKTWCPKPEPSLSSSSLCTAIETIWHIWLLPPFFSKTDLKEGPGSGSLIWKDHRIQIQNREAYPMILSGSSQRSEILAKSGVFNSVRAYLAVENKKKSSDVNLFAMCIQFFRQWDLSAFPRLNTSSIRSQLVKFAQIQLCIPDSSLWKPKHT